MKRGDLSNWEENLNSENYQWKENVFGREVRWSSEDFVHKEMRFFIRNTVADHTIRLRNFSLDTIPFFSVSVPDLHKLINNTLTYIFFSEWAFGGKVAN